MASKSKVKVGVSDIERIEKRIKNLEEVIMRFSKDATSVPTNLSFDITPILAIREKSILLKALYPDQESRIYNFKDMEMTNLSSGYYPNQQRWRDAGIYLGGCERSNEQRRAVIIPMCLSQGLAFFTPQGLTTLAADVRSRLDATVHCSSAIIDFTGDEVCLNNYSAGLDILFFFAQGFTAINLLRFPDNIVEACMKFDESELGQNLCGPYMSVTLRKRRQEYYEIIQLLISEGWRTFFSVSGPLGLSQILIDQRSSFLKAHNDGLQMTILQRLEIWRGIKAREWKSDIAHALICILGMLIFGEFRTRELLDSNAPEWTMIRGEFESLLLKSDRARIQLNELDQADSPYDDRYFHLEAFVDLVTTTNEVISQNLHLH